MTGSEFVLVYCTCPSDAVAGELGRALVSEKLAACVTVLPGVRSIYRWRDELEEEVEVLLMIKTRKSSFEALRKGILKRHPYELPEIVAVALADGHHAYLDWIAESTR